jgi:pimeloyl-ACP methyl ester carboxylesterase
MMKIMNDELPLILLPGLGADSRMFSSIRNGLPQTVTPPWIRPDPRETVAEYARRFAPIIDPGRPCYIGGASFGAVMALEIAAILPNIQACFVIGSIRHDRSKPVRIRMLKPITPLVGLLPTLSPLIVRLIGRWLRAPTRGVLIQLADTDARFLRWGAQAILNWKPSPELDRVRTFQIHGDRDRVFPIHLTAPDVIVPGAGHLIAITHPKPVTEYLSQTISALQQESSPPGATDVTSSEASPPS